MGDAQVPEETPTILVVEDEVLVRSATSNYLRACGFNVLEAANAEEALETILADRQVRLVFADIRLPGAHSGLDLVRIIRGSHPNLKLLLYFVFILAKLLFNLIVSYRSMLYFAKLIYQLN